MRDWQAYVRARLQTDGLRPDLEQDVIDDLAGQLEEACRDALARGMTDADAEAAAIAHVTDWTTLSRQVAGSRRVSHGILDRVEIRAGDAGVAGRPGAGFFASVLHDVRYALRLARQAPFFTGVAVLTLSLGIGANTTIFSWINAFLLDPLPGADGRAVVDVRTLARNGALLSTSYPDYLDLREATPAASHLIVHDLQTGSLASGAGAERIWIELASDNFFDALRVRLAAGRGFQPHEGRDAVPVLVVSERLARARFGSAAAAIDQSLVINRTPFTIVGVAPEIFPSGYTGLFVDAWMPVPMASTVMPGPSRTTMRGNNWLESMARLDPGVTPEQASLELTAAARRIAEANGRESTSSIVVTPFWRSTRGAQAVLGPVLMVLMAMVAIVLLIACANIANLLLSRSAARAREFALRLSLGCGRGRLIRQLLTESLVLVAFAAAGAVLMQMWTSGVLLMLMPPNNMPIGMPGATMNWRVLAFTALAAFGSAVVFGLAPALQAGRTDLVTSLKSDARVAGGRGRLRHALVVSQMAFALVLLVSAGLFLRSLTQVRHYDYGFTADRVLIGSVDLYSAGYDPARGARFVTDVLDQLRAIPGVEAASVARRVPLGISTGSSSSSIEPEGYVAPKDDPAFSSLAWVGADYFRVMGIPVRAGREYAASDRPDHPQVIVVNQAFADRFWPGQAALGKRVRYGKEWLAVAGVVANSKYRRLDEAASPFIYFSTTWNYRPDLVFHVRTTQPPESLADALRTTLRRADPALPVYAVMTLGDHVQAASFQQRVAASMLAVFGGLALLLASVGLYASMAYTVSRRTREIGARLALGATPADIRRLVLGQASRLIGIGVAIGLVLALGAAQLFASLLFGVPPFDPATFAGVSALLAMVAAVASYVPAQRASKLDPLKALRID